jgi:hypothetical protein
MRKISSNPNLQGTIRGSSPIRKSTSGSSLAALSNDVSVEIVTHAPINSVVKCMYMYGFPNEVLNKDVAACIMTPEDDERKQESCPVQDARFERAASIVRRRKKKST